MNSLFASHLIPSLTLIAATLVPAFAYASSDPIIDQAAAYTAIYGNSLTAPAKVKIPGVISLKSVMPGYVYRGGSSTMNNVPLSEQALQNLCEAGFSAAVYAYPTVGDFHEHSVNCSKGTLEYYGDSGENPTGRGKAMDVIAAAITHHQGPVFVHCWNGLHSSGNLAGSALMTFCGRSQSQAASYWADNAGGPKAAAGSKFSGEAHTGVNLSTEERAALCVD